MARKDITDIQVLQAYVDAAVTWGRSADGCIEAQPRGAGRWPYELLAQRTGQPEKVCYAAMERAERRGLIDYGVSLRAGFLTDKGKELLAAASPEATS
ncbi:MAG TPA: hypothetical protein DCQ64_13820 [Candidatus Rokubacteria bacterium]|nr:hypothetical protein [Candidatus Rokubacteria bacterium]